MPCDTVSNALEKSIIFISTCGLRNISNIYFIRNTKLTPGSLTFPDIVNKGLLLVENTKEGRGSVVAIAHPFGMSSSWVRPPDQACWLSILETMYLS